MSNFYDNRAPSETRGIDYDLTGCLQNNPQDGFDLDDIERVLAVREGERDGEQWYWTILLRDGRYVALRGGCDHTGWDCRSDADSSFHATALGAVLAVADKGIQELLIAQIFHGKDQTWREQMDKKLAP